MNFATTATPSINYLFFVFIGQIIVERQSPSIPVLLLSLACVVALMLPTTYDERASSSVPRYLHLSINQKLIAAYILGKIPSTFLRIRK